MPEEWPGLTWGELRARRPDVEAIARGLVYSVGIGLGFLGTVRADGGPRVHPISLILHGDGLYAFILPGPEAAGPRARCAVRPPHRDGAPAESG